jgi:hypothetical protein
VRRSVPEAHHALLRSWLVSLGQYRPPCRIIVHLNGGGSQTARCPQIFKGCAPEYALRTLQKPFIIACRKLISLPAGSAAGKRVAVNPGRWSGFLEGRTLKVEDAAVTLAAPNTVEGVSSGRAVTGANKTEPLQSRDTLMRRRPGRRAVQFPNRNSTALTA